MFTRHQEGLDGRAALGLVQRRPDHDVGGTGTGGDEDLFAVDDVLVAVEFGGGRDGRRVRAEAGLGDGHGRPDLAEAVTVFLAGDARYGGVAQALVGHREQQTDIAPAHFEGIEQGGHVGAVDVLLSGVLFGAERLGAGEGEGAGRGDTREQRLQGLQFDGVGVLGQVVLTRDGPHQLGSALMPLLDDGLQLLGEFQIDCHGKTFV
ncbi:Uncharacterised protein [Mycobacteroides abscessus subsp. massiliense]|nr:Uncharacterised protein [Mycobacteroides abscessus subsp. massiliense]